MGDSLDTWRSRIGTFHSTRIRTIGVFVIEVSRGTKTVLGIAVLLFALLVVEGIERNPGPGPAQALSKRVAKTPSSSSCCTSDRLRATLPTRDGIEQPMDVDNPINSTECIRIFEPKAIKTVHWNLCIICQTKKKDGTNVASSDGKIKLKEAAMTRNDDVLARIQTVCDELDSQHVIYHKSCYSTYCHPRNIPMVTDDVIHTGIPSHPPHPIPLTPTVFLRSNDITLPNNWDVCLFCNKISHKKNRQMHPISSQDTSNVIYKCAVKKGDDVMLNKIGTNNLIEVKAKYHKTCHSSYTSKLFEDQKESTMNNISDDDAYGEAFNELCTNLSTDMSHGKAYTMSSLLTNYKCILENKNITTADSYTSQRLKQRLIKHFGNKLVFYQPDDKSKSEIVYSNEISVQDILQMIVEQNDDKIKNDVVHGVINNPDKTGDSEDSSILYKAALILKNCVAQVEGINIRPLDIQNFCSIDFSYILPDKLKRFLTCLLVNNCEFNSDKHLTDANKRHVSNIGQDILHCVSNGRLKTPKHIGLGMTVRHQTGSPELVTLLNRMGHSCCYADTDTVDTGLAKETIAKSEANGCVIPSNITPGKFVQASADNLDFSEMTMDGKGTTHVSTIILIQEETADTSRNNTVYADHTNKTRDVNSNLLNRNLDFINVNKKPKLCDGGTSSSNILSYFNDNTRLANSLDLSWCILRLIKTIIDIPRLANIEGLPNQKVPGWSGYNASLSLPTTRSKVGYCPVINSPPTDQSTVYTIVNRVKEITKAMGQRTTVITFDMAIYSIAKTIQWNKVQEMANVVIRLGGFHIALNYLSSIGRMFGDLGLSDILVESAVYGYNTVANIISGKPYDRAIRAHKLMYEALTRMLLKEINIDEDTIENELNIPDTRACHSKITGKNTLDDSDRHNMTKEMDKIQQKVHEYMKIGKSKSHIYKIWIMYMEAVQILLDYIRAERTGDWDLHLQCTTKMIPFFFVMDRTYYSRWLPVYVREMMNLRHAHPDVYKEFSNGNHSVSRTGHPFTKVWTDMMIEQTVNCDAKKRGGVIGITKKEKAMSRWFLTCHDRAAIANATKNAADMTSSSQSLHKDEHSHRMTQDEIDVRRITKVITSGAAMNPFDVSSSSTESVSLVNIVSGTVISEETAIKLTGAYEAGKQKFQEFVETRLDSNRVDFWQPIQRINLKKDPRKKSKSNATAIPSMGRNIFGRMLVLAQSRNIQLKNLLSYELTPYPTSLTYSDGSLRKSDKSDLLHEIECKLENLINLPTVVATSSRAVIVDGMAVLQSIKTTGLQTFRDFAERITSIILSQRKWTQCVRIDVVFDTYLTDSIKNSERKRRGQSGGCNVKIVSPLTQLPTRWDIYLKNPSNKTNLMNFLFHMFGQLVPSQLRDGESFYVGGGGDDPTECIEITNGGISRESNLTSNHEEADTRMFIHVEHASRDHDEVVIVSPDTDVAVLAVNYFSMFKIKQLWFNTGTGDKRRYIPIHRIVNRLSPNAISSLLSLHGMTGCDTTSSLGGIGKKTVWTILNENVHLHQLLSTVGENIPPTTSTLLDCEKFLSFLYTTTRYDAKDLDDVRYWCFVQDVHKSGILPPTSDSGRLHINRANYQIYIWKRALIRMMDLPTPIGNGWEVIDGQLQPSLMSQGQAPKDVLEFVTCHCTKQHCDRGSCSCFKRKMACTEACSCMSGETCHNIHNHSYDDDSDDNE